MTPIELSNRLHLKLPIWLAPMTGACPPALSIAVAKAGGLAACGAVAMTPAEILAWADAVRPHGAFQINLWIPSPAPVRDAAALLVERRWREARALLR